MQELAAGYNFIPIKPVPSASPETDDPLLIEQKHWRVATFQDRYLEWIEHDGKKYGVAVAVDGQGLRFKHYTGMNRKGMTDIMLPCISKIPHIVQGAAMFSLIKVLLG